MTDREAISNFEKRNFWLKANPCCQRIQSRVDKQNGEIERNEAAISALRERMEREDVPDINVGDNWISVERELRKKQARISFFTTNGAMERSCQRMRTAKFELCGFWTAVNGAIQCALTSGVKLIRTEKSPTGNRYRSRQRRIKHEFYRWQI